MILFKCVFTEQEFSSLRTTIPADDYCIIRNSGDKYYYGIIDDGLHGSFVDVLSGETLEQLEYLDEEDVRKKIGGADGYEIVGNEELLRGVL